MKLMKTKKRPDEPRSSLTEQIYQKIKQDLFSFRLLPGDRFSENEIAERVDASRTPVREALTRLQREGFVDVSFRSGWQVKPFDFDQFEQLYDVLLVIETAALKILCKQGATPDLDELKVQWLIVPEKQEYDNVDICELDESFHCGLVNATGNNELTRIHYEVIERLRIVRRIEVAQPSDIDNICLNNAKMLRAIIEKRDEDAKKILTEQITLSKAAVRNITLHMLYEAKHTRAAQ